MVSVWIADLTLPMTLALVLALGVSWAFHLKRACLIESDAVCRVACMFGEWRLILRNGRLVHVQLTGEILVLPWLLVLCFVDSWGHRYRVPVLRDGSDAAGFRRLKVFARFAIPAMMQAGRAGVG